jgi:signal transduction histidine kinase
MAEPSESRRLDEHLIMLGRLASSLSHEIRTPLASLFLLVDALEEDLWYPRADSHAQMVQSLTDMKTALICMNELVQDYLSLARLADLRREPVDLGTVVETFALEIQQQLADRAITLHMAGLEGLGQVALHRNAFHRLLVNLVQNAIDAMPQGGTLTFRGWQECTQVHLEVHDSGNGIAEDQLSQLFVPFHTTKPEGTGLGLYVVQEILAAHGGSITLTSTRGIGTTCTLTLPLMAAAATVANGY